MKLVPAKCPNCGANIDVDEDQETTKCQYCGDAILIDKAIQKYQIDINVTNVPNLNNYMILADRSYNDKDYNKASQYYSNAIALDPNNYLIVLKLAISDVLKEDYSNINLKNFNSAIINSIKLADKDLEKYLIICNESFSCIKIIQNKMINFYDNNQLNREQAVELNNNCLNVLTVLENLLSIDDYLSNIEWRTALLDNIIIFADFVIEPKIYIKISRNGNKSKYSIKLDKKERKEVYDFWNSSIDKYNRISEKKINNKKLPLVQLDSMEIKILICVIIIIICFIITII